jgi:flagellar biosynthesis/type III secretory pathway protein FliH
MRHTLRLPDLGAPPPPPAPPPPDPEVLLAEARAAGVVEGRGIGHAAGLAEGRAEQMRAQEAAMQRALERIAALLAEAGAAGRRTAEEAAQALAALLMQTLDLALPGAAARLAPEIVAHVAVPLITAIADRPEAVLRVAPGLVEPIAARLPSGAPQVVADESVPPGDARLAWRDGAIVIDLAQRRAAVAETLRMVGIWPGDQEDEP